MRFLFKMKSNVELAVPFAVLAMILTGRVVEFTVAATDISTSTVSWVPKKVKSLGLTVKVTPGTVDVVERTTSIGLAVVSSWLIMAV